MIVTDSVHKLVSFGIEDFKGSLLVQVIYTAKKTQIYVSLNSLESGD